MTDCIGKNFYFPATPVVFSSIWWTFLAANTDDHQVQPIRENSSLPNKENPVRYTLLQTLDFDNDIQQLEAHLSRKSLYPSSFLNDD